MFNRVMLFILLLVSIGIGVWLYTEKPWQWGNSDQNMLTSLPKLPEFVYQNEVSIEKFLVADRWARENVMSGDAVGRLGMLYHAYQFTNEARRSYTRARELQPDEFAWIYYLAVLEKATFRFPESEVLFRQAITLKPDSAELWAELGDLQMKRARGDEAALIFARALELDPREPLAALGKGRLEILARNWKGAIALLMPILDDYPRLSLAHKYLAVSYEQLGEIEQYVHHQALSEYGSALESSLMKTLHDLSINAILQGGDRSAGPALLQVKCARCHNDWRIDETHESRDWWASTVRRMQREAGWEWLTDGEAASVVEYLSSRP